MNTWQDLLPARPGVAAAIGRHPVFSVALTMETAVREGLPKLSRKKIENYLRDHVLVLQSRLYHDEAGTVFFGDCERYSLAGAGFLGSKRVVRGHKSANFAVTRQGGRNNALQALVQRGMLATKQRLHP